MLQHDTRVYIFCNCSSSYEAISARFFDFPHLKAVFLNGNIGLSRAYNALLEIISEDGFPYFYIFDQDTEISKFFFEVKDAVVKYVDPNCHVMLQLQSTDSVNSASEVTVSNPMFIINSGSLINIKLIRQLESFPNNYFVDGIDYYVSIKAKLAGLKIGYLNGFFGLNHTVNQGDDFISIFGKKVPVRNYGWSRIRDVTLSHLKLIMLSLKNFKLDYAYALSKFLLAFYFRNLLSLIPRL